MRITLAFVAGLSLLPALSWATQYYEEITIGHVYSLEESGREDSINIIVRHPGLDGSRQGATAAELELECNGGLGPTHVWLTPADAQGLAANLDAAVAAALSP